MATIKKGVMYYDSSKATAFFPQTSLDMIVDEETNQSAKVSLDAKQNKVLYGTTAPTSSVGSDGDIYILLES